MAALQRLSERYTLAELEKLTGFSGRTIRYYITEGLLSPAYGRGPSATYDQDHYLRLQMIDTMKQERQPLNAIRERLSQLTTDDLALMMNTQQQPQMALWRHYTLHPDLEIRIRDLANGDRPATHEYAFDLIIEYARSVLADLDQGVNQ